MLVSESDRKLVDLIATIWVSQGGDAEGLDWVYSDLRAAIQDKQLSS